MTLVQGRTGEWEVVIGLEIHAQISSESKLFSGASTEYGGAPNTNVSLVDAAFPGMLPVLNEFCVKQAVKTGLGINGSINKVSIFDRKNYFYADLPQGYQISQFYHPIVQGGYVDIINEDKSDKRISITRIHLEQDAGKSIHDQSPTESYIDLNRCGIALMEIVTDPDIRSAYEAGEFLKKLRSILRCLGTCDGNMEQGSMRCDANVSVRRPGEAFGTRCEIKNLNSIKNVMRAINYEVDRQIALIENGEAVSQETRLFNADTSSTRTMRSKEDAQDYRYFPDPDLLPVKISDDYIKKIRESIPELPDHKKARYIKDYSLNDFEAGILSGDSEVSAYFEEILKTISNPKLVSSWITGELFGRLNKAGLTFGESKIASEQLIGLLGLIEDSTISGKIAKEVFDIMFETGEHAAAIVDSRGLKQIVDTGAIEKIIEEVIAENQDKVAEYRSGKDKLFGFFVGQVMKKSSGKLNPQMVNGILKSKL
jgi:aspartyl-tRNA(Asn)/glutamyl-tRNA(Gln) amidotransferase subunit B